MTSVAFHQVTEVVRNVFDYLFLENILSGATGVCKLWHDVVFDGRFLNDHRKRTCADKFVSVAHKNPKSLAFDWIELVNYKYPDVYEGLLNLKRGLTDISVLKDRNAPLADFARMGVQISLVANQGRKVQLYAAKKSDTTFLVGAFVNDSNEIVDKSASTKFEVAEMYYEVKVYDFDRERVEHHAKNYEWLESQFSEYLLLVPPGIFWSRFEHISVMSHTSKKNTWMFDTLVDVSVSFRAFADRSYESRCIAEAAEKRYKRLKDPQELFRQAVDAGISGLCTKLLPYGYVLYDCDKENIFINALREKRNGDMIRFLFQYAKLRKEKITKLVQVHLQYLLTAGTADTLRAMHENNVKLPTEFYDTDSLSGDHDYESLDYLKEVHPNFYCPFDLRRSEVDKKPLQTVLFLYENDDAKLQLKSLLTRYTGGEDNSRRAELKYEHLVIPPKVFQNKQFKETEFGPLGLDKYDIVLYTRVLPDTNISQSKLDHSRKVIQALKNICSTVVFAYSISIHNSALIMVTDLNRTMEKVFQGIRRCKFINLRHSYEEELEATLLRLDRLLIP